MSESTETPQTVMVAPRNWAININRENATHTQAQKKEVSISYEILAERLALAEKELQNLRELLKTVVDGTEADTIEAKVTLQPLIEKQVWPFDPTPKLVEEAVPVPGVVLRPMPERILKRDEELRPAPKPVPLQSAPVVARKISVPSAPPINF